VFRYVATADISGAAMAGVVGATLLLVAALFGATLAACRLAGAGRATAVAAILATTLYNSGNIGVPLAELAFPGGLGRTVQSFVLSTQSVLTFTLGLALAGSAAGGGWRTSTGRMLRMPVLYALAAAFAFRAAAGNEPADLPAVIDPVSRYLANALVPVALVTLGMQLAIAPRWPRWRVVSFVCAALLLAAPALMAGITWGLSAAWPGGAMDLWPTYAAVLIVTAGVPTAVNALLLTMELGGDDRLMGDCVFYTTVLSPVTLLPVIAIGRMMVG